MVKAIEEKFASIDNFEAALMARGGVEVATPDFKVRASFLAACMSAALLNAVLGQQSHPFVDAAFDALRKHLKANSGEFSLSSMVRWSNFFNVSPSSLPFTSEVFLAATPELRGSALTSSITAFDALMFAFADEVINLVFDRSNSGEMIHAAALICADIMFGDGAMPDPLLDIHLADAMAEMITKISRP